MLNYYNRNLQITIQFGEYYPKRIGPAGTDANGNDFGLSRLAELGRRFGGYADRG
jgi:hypothetical protein